MQTTVILLQSETDKMLTEIKELREKMKAVAAETRNKEELHKRFRHCWEVIKPK